VRVVRDNGCRDKHPTLHPAGVASCVLRPRVCIEMSRGQDATCKYSPHFTRKSLQGGGGSCTDGWTKGLLLVENSMTHQGVTLLHTD
jgi:hypothetical protein